MIETRDALSPKEWAEWGLGDWPVIERIEVEKTIDHLGDPALYVTVVLADSTNPDDLTFEAVWPTKEAILNNLIAMYGGDFYPYIRLVPESELKELEEWMKEDEAAEECEPDV